MLYARVSFLCLVALSVACAGTSATPMSESAREGAVFFVQNHGADDRNLDQVIAGALAGRGLKATAGPRPDDVDYLVTYEDRWAWDMRTYLREIKIKVTKVDSGELVAESRAHQDSLSSMGKTYESIIQQAALRLLDGG